MQTFGQRLREKRVAAGLTQEQVAKTAGMSREAYTLLETDVNIRTLSRVPSLAKALGCTTDSLFPEMDPPDLKSPDPEQTDDDEIPIEEDGTWKRSI